MVVMDSHHCSFELVRPVISDLHEVRGAGEGKW
jgi:hypothetical protein